LEVCHGKLQVAYVVDTSTYEWAVVTLLMETAPHPPSIFDHDPVDGAKSPVDADSFTHFSSLFLLPFLQQPTGSISIRVQHG
jgi:hypothetical protein